MAIQIRKKEEEKKVQVLEPDVLPPEGSQLDDEMLQQPKPQAPGMEDKFVMRSGNAMAWLMEHRRMVMLLTLIVLVIALGWIGTQKLQESNATSHSTEVLSDAFVTYTALTKEEADKNEKERYEYFKSQGISAESDDILRYTYTVPDERSRFLKLEEHLTNTLPQHAGSAIQPSAYLMLAGAKAKLRDAASTLPAYQNAAASNSSDVKLFAMLGEAEMLIGQSNFDKAAETLDSIADQNPSFTSFVMLEKGKLLEAKGDAAGAIAIYDQIYKEPGEATAKQKALARLRILTPDWAERMKAQEIVPAPQAAL